MCKRMSEYFLRMTHTNTLKRVSCVLEVLREHAVSLHVDKKGVSAFGLIDLQKELACAQR